MLGQIRYQDTLLQMAVNILDSQNHVLTENVIHSKCAHSGAVVLDALLLDGVELKCGSGRITFLDVNIRKRIGSFHIHTIVNAVSGDHGDGNDEMITDVAKTIR